MEYTVMKLARLSGVSARTLRYYDEIGLLRPARVSSSGYRIYGQAEVDLLQQILFYRELGMRLEEIREILTSPDFDAHAALIGHRDRLLVKRARLDALIANVEKTLLNKKGEIDMSDQDKFEAFKNKLIEDNERQYGAEVRKRHGDRAMEQSNQKLREMTKEQFDQTQALEKEIIETLLAAFETGDPAGEAAQRAADLHRQWLCHYWGSYSKEAHAGIAQAYVDDPRFTAYYDGHRPGLAKFLRDAVLNYTGSQK